MNKHSSIYSISPKDGVNFQDFSDLLQQSGILDKFNVEEICYPELYFRDAFLEHISESGISSLFNFTISMEDITSPSMNINDIEKVMLAFSSKLDCAKKIVITDPYLYQLSDTTLFEKMIKSFSTNLEKIYLVTSASKTKYKSDIHNVIKSINSNIQIIVFESDDIHDRFWFDPDNNSGIVIGTSLNGVGKKIALIDRLSSNDVQYLIQELKNLGCNL